MDDITVHQRRASKTRGTTPFGVRVPDFLLHEFEAARLRYRPQLINRQEAIIEAMEQWIARQQQEGRAA